MVMPDVGLLAVVPVEHGHVGDRRAGRASAMVAMPRSPTAPSRRRAASARRRRRSRRPGRPRGTRRPGSGRPRGRRAGGRGRRASARASCGSRVRRWTVSARSLRTRRPGSRSRRPITARSGWRGSGSSTSSRTVSSGSSTATVPVPTSIVSHCARSRWVSSRAARLETQRLVPSAAALRPSRVVANFQVTNGRPCSTAKVQARLSAPGLVGQQAALDLDPGGAQRLRSPGGDRVGVGLGEHHAAYAGLDQGAGAGAGAAGVVAGLEGDHGGGARARPRRPRAARATSACGVPAPRWKPSATSSPASSRMHAADPRVGAERARRGWRRAPARAASRGARASRSAVMVISRSPRRPARGLEGAGRRYGDGRRASRRTTARPRLRALPIRTLTVGPGVPPGQPVTGCDRVADFHRRLGISPTPEHASSWLLQGQACHIRG